MRRRWDKNRTRWNYCRRQRRREDRTGQYSSTWEDKSRD